MSVTGQTLSVCAGICTFIIVSFLDFTIVLWIFAALCGIAAAIMLNKQIKIDDKECDIDSWMFPDGREDKHYDC